MPDVQDEAVDMIQRFLRLMESRDLESADKFMAPEAQITFPGGVKYSSQADMVKASRGRYRWVKKNFGQTEAFEAGVRTVVYLQGTLYGENMNGVAFEGVRFIDRFEIENGLIVRQDVWNDLAASDVLNRH